MKELQKRVLTFVLIAAIMTSLAVGLTGCGSISITSVTIPAMLALVKGEVGQLNIDYGADKDNVAEDALLEAAERLELEWSSSDEAVAVVDENGNVTAIDGGEATITVSVDGADIQSTCKVTVRVPLTGFEAEHEMQLYINGSIEDIIPSKPLVVGPIPADADDYAPTYTSADESIATVDKDGVVTAVSNGRTTITVKSGDISTEVEVTVYTAPAFIEVEDAELYVGRSGELDIKVDADGVTFTNPLTYKSSDEDVCEVDEDGAIAGISEGEATITVSNGTGVVGTATVTVVPVPVVTTTGNGNASGNAGSTGGSGSSGGNSAGASDSTGSSGGASAPAPAPAPTPAPSSSERCTYCSGSHNVNNCPNIKSRDVCDVCGGNHCVSDCPDGYRYVSDELYELATKDDGRGC